MCKRWVKLDKHHQATVDDWRASNAQRWSINGDSQYNPELYGDSAAVQKLEEDCISNGTLIGNATHRIRKYLRKKGVNIGYCKGELTDYVFAECTSGAYHG